MVFLEDGGLLLFCSKPSAPDAGLAARRRLRQCWLRWTRLGGGGDPPVPAGLHSATLYCPESPACAVEISRSEICSGRPRSRLVWTPGDYLGESEPPQQREPLLPPLPELERFLASRAEIRAFLAVVYCERYLHDSGAGLMVRQAPLPNQPGSR